jgi:multidrug efflux pump subunit AcrB
MERILRFFAKDNLLIALMSISIVVFGVLSMRNIRRETMPPVDIDLMNINIVYPGASAEDVELNVIVPIEDELRRIYGIDEFFSVSVENGGALSITIDQEVTDKQGVKDEIYRKVSKSGIPEIPDEVEEINIVDINPRLRAVYKLALSPKEADSATEKELNDMAETLESLLERVAGVSQVDKTGFRDREVHIDVYPDKMDEYYVSLNEVAAGIKNRNVRSTGGTIQSLRNEKTIVTIGELEKPMDAGSVIVRSGFEQKRLKISDIARVRDSFKKENIRVRVNSEKAIVLSVRKDERADIISVINNIKSFLEENRSLFSDKFSISVVEDNSVSIRSLLGVVVSNAAIGFILVIIVLFIFLDYKTSFWTAFSIPFSLLMVAGFMYAADISLNIMTLGAIITVLGMLVDDSVVVAEVIFEKKQQGLSPLEAVISGTREILAPVTVTILTTIVAFMPIMMVQGKMGKFIYIYPVMITITLLSSLVEAFFFLPSHLASGKTVSPDTGRWFESVVRSYGKALKWVLKFRYLFVAAVIFLLIFTVLISRDTIKGFVLFWDDSSEKFTVNIEARAGMSLSGSEEIASIVEKKITETIPGPEIVSVYSIIGTFSGKTVDMVEYHENRSTVQVTLVPGKQRKMSADDYVRNLRREITAESISGVSKIIFIVEQFGPPAGLPVDIKVINSDEKTALAAALEIEEYLAGISGVRDIDNDRKKGKGEVKLNFNYDRLAEYGLNVSDVAATVRTAFEGSVASSVQTVGRRIDFRVQIPDSHKKDAKLLMNLLVPNRQGRLIRISEIASMKNREGRSSIRHYNGDRSITISADVDSTRNTSGKVNAIVKNHFRSINEKYPGTYLIFSGESGESKKAMKGLGSAFIMAIILVYFIVVLLYRSLSQPLIVISVIPFGLIGVLAAFTLHGVPLSFMGIIGIIGLSGVLVNDSIIMVSFINKIYAGGTEDDGAVESRHEAVIEGAKKRLRPVVLTTVTTVAGLMPTVYGIGGNAMTLVPTVMALAYGLLFGSLLTLAFIPALYVVNEDIKLAGRKFFRAVKI